MSTHPVLLVAIFLAACGSRPATPAALPAAKTAVLAVENVDWQQLNPARGKSSPAAATLWGDRKGEQATGFLARFVDGFSSPPHIHNVSYRAVVIQGLVHNADPNAVQLWMPPGSFWTQPFGASHITSAKGGTTIAFVEIDSGPYLVRPIDQAKESGEYPINVHADNVVWLDFAGVTGWSAPAGKAEVAFLWGDPDAEAAHGLFVRLAAGAKATLRNASAPFNAVVIAGTAEHQATGAEKPASLAPGSLLSAESGATRVRCKAAACTIYVHAKGRFSASAE